MFAASPPLSETRHSLRFLAAPETWVIVLVILPLVLAFAWWVYRRSAARTGRRGGLVLAGLRALTLLFVLAVLWQPVAVTTRERVIPYQLVLLVDDSASMQERDAYADPKLRASLARAAGLQDANEVTRLTRSELVARVLTAGRPPLLAALRRRFDVRLHAFDTALRRSVAPADLTAEGTATRLGEALRAVLTEQAGRPTAAVVLFSDGRTTAGEDPVQVLERLRRVDQIQVPLLVFAVGDPTERKDVELRLVKPASGQEFLAGDRIPFTVEVASRGYPGEVTVTVQILEEGRVLAEQVLAVKGKGGVRKEILYVKAEKAGRRVYTARVTARPDEADLANNRQEVALTIVKKRIRVLYVEGYPRWEYRFLKNALIRDREGYAVNVLLLSAERDFVQESSPDVEPLYAFPRERSVLETFDVVILGDVDPAQLGDTPEEAARHLENLKWFVNRVGGGLLFLAGEGWNPRAYVGTPLEPLLPVIPAPPGAATPGYEEPFRPRRTDLGLKDPMLLLSRDPEENQRLWSDPEGGLPPLYWYAPVERAKPGARVLLVHPRARNRFGPVPLLAAQFYGRGRTLFLGLDSLWRWRRYRGDTYFFQFYTQAIRYLATTRLYRESKRYDLFTDRLRYDIGEPVHVRAAVRDADYNPSRAETQTVYWQKPHRAKPVAVTLHRVRPGHYETVLTPAHRGRHLLWIPQAPEVERPAVTATFEVELTPLEKANPATDTATLRRLAEEGGAYHLLAEAPAVLTGLEKRVLRIPEHTTTRDIWDRGTSALLLVLLLTAEWLLRRRFGLV